ncbi:MAG TPA: hypothetical protein VM097_09270 [Mycobacteriales bacterium]|nr:hypothetical protein [Mycobacteriales bacterium]
MNRTLTSVPALALAALCLGAGAPPASADELPLPVAPGVAEQLAALLPVPTPSPTTALPLLPAPTAGPAPALATETTPTAPSKVIGVPQVRSAAGSRPVVAPAVVPEAAAPMTGATSGLRFSSATTPAWLAAYTGTTAPPTLAGRPAVTAPGPTAPSPAPAGLPQGLGALALALLALTGGAHVLLRRGLLPLR